MEKMIKVINDNLRTVINGIKSHKSDTESSLATIQNKMDDRVKLAGEYRANVEDARQIISTLENEISTLENDLNDLKKKFDSKDFKEILKVGSKEINNKIGEKKSLIAEQSQRIIALTDKAHKLKNELVSLKEKRIALENTLEKDNILEAYYENRIMEVIEFSEEHINDLKEYIEVEPQTTLMTSTDEVQNIDITSAIDGSIFEEIEEISNSTDSDEFDGYVDSVLTDDIELDDEESEDDDDGEDNKELFMTQQIDDIISQANDLLEKSKTLEEKVIPGTEEDTIDIDPSISNDDYSYGETIKLDDVPTVSTPMFIEENADDESDEEETSNDTEENTDDTDEDTTNGAGLTLPLEETPEEEPIIEEVEEVEPYQPDTDEEDDEEPEFEIVESDEDYEKALLDSALEDVPVINDDIPEITLNDDVGNLGDLNLTSPEDLKLEEDNEETDSVEENTEADVVDEENMFSALEEFNGNNEPEEIKIENDPLSELEIPTVDEEEPLNDTEDTGINLDIPIIEESETKEVNEEAEAPEENNDHVEDVKQEMEEANLDVSKFDDDTIEAISENYTKNNIINIIYTMRKHNIAISKIYESANILKNMSSEDLDYVINLLEKTNASSDSLSYVFNMLDKVDIYKLEEKLSTKTTYELSELLYDVIPYEGEVDLAGMFNLNPSEVNALRSFSSTEEYEMINQFSNIVLANYNELKKYNVNNLNECITKHPHRFLFNPDNFAAILDKYDAEDLTRCVNKNSAVIDKL